MRLFLLLVRVQMRGLANSLFPGRTNMTSAERKRRVAFGSLGLSLLLVLMLFYTSAFSLGLAASGLASTLPVLAMFLAALQGVVFTFFKANGVLFGFKDYDLIMSLPIPRSTVVASRIAALLCAAEAMAITTIPMVVVYFIYQDPTPFAVTAFALGIILAPLVPTTLAALASFGITAITARFRHANIAYIIGAMVFLALVLIASVGLSVFTQSSTDSQLVQSLSDVSTSIQDVVTTAYPPAAWASRAVVEGSLVDFVLYTTASLGVTGLGIAAMQRYYLQINGALAAYGTTGGGEAALKRSRTRARSPFWAIVFKEWRTLVGIPTYALNCLFGYFFVILVAAAISFLGLQTILTSGSINGVSLDPALASQGVAPTTLIIPWIFAFCAIMCDSSVVSISLEGRSAWLMSTLPLPTKTVLGAKFASNALPFAAALAIGIVVMLASGTISLITALETATIAVGAFLLWIGVGLSLDVRRPNFTWMSAQDVVKRSAPIMACVMGGMLYSFSLGALSVAGSMAIGVDTMHIANLIVGIITCIYGAIRFRRLIDANPALYS